MVHFILPLFFILFISSCSKSINNPWSLEKDNVNSPWVSARLSLASVDVFRDLSIELIQTAHNRKMHVSAYSKRFTPSDNSPLLVPLHLKINKQASTVLCQSIDGGQKLTLPEETSNLIINHLLNGDQVSLFIDQYRAELDPITFKARFKDLEDFNNATIAKVQKAL
jgi:hypothetical protein